MKKILYMCMMLLAATLTFTACGSDDDDNPNDPTNPQQQGEVVRDDYYKYQESVEINGYGSLIVIGEATFEKGVCNAMAFSYVFSSKQLANAVWKSFQDDEELADDLKYYSYDGDKTIVYRMNEDVVRQNATLGKEYVCGIVKATVKTMISAFTYDK